MNIHDFNHEIEKTTRDFTVKPVTVYWDWKAENDYVVYEIHAQHSINDDGQQVFAYCNWAVYKNPATLFDRHVIDFGTAKDKSDAYMQMYQVTKKWKEENVK